MGSNHRTLPSLAKDTDNNSAANTGHTGGAQALSLSPRDASAARGAPTSWPSLQQSQLQEDEAFQELNLASFSRPRQPPSRGAGYERELLMSRSKSMSPEPFLVQSPLPLVCIMCAVVVAMGILPCYCGCVVLIVNATAFN